MTSATDLTCEDCGDTIPRPAIGRPPLRCDPCNEEHFKAKNRQYVRDHRARQEGQKCPRR